MARILNEEEHAARRNEILDAALQLIYTRGYEQMTIQDVIDALHISKGAFYHYFDSKHALLEGVVYRMTDAAKGLIQPIIDDPRLSAIEKFHAYFDTGVRWKSDRKDFFLALLRVWYHDDNAIVRQKVTATGMQWIRPVMETIIRQGVREGVFTTPTPEETGVVVVSLLESMSTALAALILAGDIDNDQFDLLTRTVSAHQDALERILRAPTGSLHLMDVETLRVWVMTKENAV
jgi:AcrR family transcriptional regulator